MDDKQPRESDIIMVNALGLKCPIPVLRVQKALRDALDGTTLVMLADDPSTWKEVPVFCKQAGYQLERAEKDENGKMRFAISKNRSEPFQD